MAIVERAFSYGGLLVRTFHHADPAPSEPQSATPAAPSPPWTSEQLPPPKRPRGGQKKKRKTADPPSPIQLDLSGLLTPGATASEGGELDSACVVGDQPQMPQYISLLTPDELRAIQTRHRKGKLWIPPESTVRKELERLGRGIKGEAAVANMKKAMLADGPVRYMQETGCITDVDRFAVEGALGVPGLRETPVPGLEVFTGVDCSTTDAASGWPAQRVQELGKDGAAQSAVGNGRGNGHIHLSPTHGVTLPSPIPVSTKDDQQGLYLPPLLTQVANAEPPISPSRLLSTTHSHQVTSIPAQPLYDPPPEDFSVNTTASNYQITLAPSPPQPKRGRGRPRKSPQTSDSTPTPEAPSSIIPTSIFTSPALAQSPSSQKRKRPTPPPKPTNHKPPPLHLSSVSEFLSHLTSTITTAASGFIPRPVNICYTLPIPTPPALAEPLDKDYKTFAVGLVAKVAEIDKLQWTIAHSQWTTSKGKFTAGARWVCNLSEEGVRDRGAKGGAPAGVGVRAYTYTSDIPKLRYPCGGSIAVRFSTNKDIITIRYTHHAVHAPPKDLREEAQMKKFKEHRNLIANEAWAPTSGLPTTLPLPLPPPIVGIVRPPLQVVEAKAVKGVTIGESEDERGGRWMWERMVGE